MGVRISINNNNVYNLFSNITIAQQIASTVLKEAKKLFEDSLEIEGEVILVDSRKEDCDGMTRMKGILKERRDNMIVSFFFNPSISYIL